MLGHGKADSSSARPGKAKPRSKRAEGAASVNEPVARSTVGTTRSTGARTGAASKKPGKGRDKAPRKGYGIHRSSGEVQTIEARPAIIDPAAKDAKARQSAESEAVALVAIEAALDKKALMPVLIDVSGMASYTDFIAIVSGRSDRQVDAIADGVLVAMKARGRHLLGQEGSGSGRWTLLDFGDVVIHVFYHPVREFYDLESLWVDAPRIPLKVPPEAIMTQPDALYGNP
jgi:ribosome-associated protein